MRVFVAVFPPATVQEALTEAARALPTDAFRLTPARRVHLTLKFLGEVSPEDLPRVAAALGRAARAGEPFDAVVSGFGAFPSARRARILWAGIGAGADGFRALSRAVEDLLEPEGFARDDRPFVPHLTIGRAPSGPGRAWRRARPAPRLRRWRVGPRREQAGWIRGHVLGAGEVPPGGSLASLYRRGWGAVGGGAGG